MLRFVQTRLRSLAGSRASALRAFAGLAACCATAAADDVTWNQQMVTGPALRSAHTLSFDSTRNVAVLFGGTHSAYYGDTWEWDGAAWLQVATTGPAARWGSVMNYDDARNETILFGGFTTTTLSNQTWKWDGTTWTLLTSVGPSGRYYCGSAYDSARDVIVLFGGVRASRNSETWEWDGTQWTFIDNTGPTPRYAPAMCYDSARGVTVLFGGNAGSGDLAYNGETWEYDGTSWTMVANTGPVGRYTSSMVYDSDRGVCVLYGGFGPGATYLGDTWEWDGTAWTERTVPGNGNRAQHAMTYDTFNDVTLLFGGVVSDVRADDTWELVATADPCPADLSGSSDPNDPAYGTPDGAVDSSDFFYYLDQFTGGNLAVADVSGSADPNDPAYGVPDGSIDSSDFFYFLDLFVADCP